MLLMVHWLHKDSMGNGSVIRRGDIQRMSAGSGITHSEYNHSKSESVHFLQIWFLPDKPNIPPGYAQKTFPREQKIGALQLMVSPTGRDGSISINQDVDIYAGILEDSSQSFTHTLMRDRKAWVHIVTGTLTVNCEDVKAGDGIAVSSVDTIVFTNGHNAEVIVLDMAPR